ncbi:hypothetical protein RB595_008865 [Gaeumannomyces hyphopodioides]
MKPISGALALWALSQMSPAAGAALQDCKCQNSTFPLNGTVPAANGTLSGNGNTSSNRTNKAYPLKWCDADDYEWRVKNTKVNDEYRRPWKLNGCEKGLLPTRLADMNRLTRTRHVARWCGIYDTGFLPNAKTLISQTPELMEKAEWKKQITIPAKTCIRIKCWNTTGLYLCNVRFPFFFPQWQKRDQTDSDQQPKTKTKKQARLHNITLHTKWDIVPAFEAANYCCQGQAISIFKQRASGEWRHPCGWSAIVAYANCNHPPVTPWPSKIWPMQNGSNPNGNCLHGTEEELLPPPIAIEEEEEE